MNCIADKKYADTKSVYGVEIFAVGTHNGEPYTAEDLDSMVVAFQDLRGTFEAPFKIGHTSDEFNTQLAREMGVPEAMLSGENGCGAMALGWVKQLRRSGNVLVADFVDVPQAVADLIARKAYKKVSAEIMFDFKQGGTTYPKILSGVALLGADLPAVASIRGLETAAVFSLTQKPDSVIETDLSGGSNVSIEEVKTGLRKLFSDLEGGIAKLFGSTAREDEEPKVKLNTEEESMKSVLTKLGLAETATEEQALGAVVKLQADVAKFQGDIAGTIKQIAIMLGLPETATIEEVMAAMEQMKAAVAGSAPAAGGGVAGMMTAKFANMESRLKSTEAELAGEKRKARVAHFTAMANQWSVEGKPEDLAEKIVNAEEKDPETANLLVSQYAATSEALKKAGLFRAKGTPAQGDSGDEHAFTKEMHAYMLEKHVDEPTAQAELRKAKPELWREYRKSLRATPAGK